MAYTGPQYTYSTTPGATSNPAFPDWQAYMGSLQLDPDAYPLLKKQSQTAAQLAVSPALRNLTQQRAAALRNYGFAKGEVNPEYDRFVAEQAYNLGQTLAGNQYSRDRSNQDYDISSRNMGDQLKEQLRRTEQDMARRGLWQSGILNEANLGLQGKYITSQGDIERSRYNRMADIERTGDLAKQKATFNLSDAQRMRVDKLQKLLDQYQGSLGDITGREQSLAEEQGLRQQDLYSNLLQQQFINALNARKEGLAETEFHHTAWWAKANADEDRRRYELQRQLDAAARKAQGLAY
jgi:hypothetical protein